MSGVQGPEEQTLKERYQAVIEEQNQRTRYERYRHNRTSTRMQEEQNQTIIYRYNRKKYQTARGTEPEDHLQVQ